MSKLKTHLKNYGLIYLVLVLCLAVIGITLIVSKVNKENDVDYVDTSMFNVVSISDVNKMFETDEPTYLVIGLNTCSATISYGKTLQIAEAMYGFTVNYLELADVDTTTSDFTEFMSNLDVDATMQDEEGTLAEFLGNTPMTLIIKNKKVVYSFIGSLSDSVVETLVTKYDLSSRE